MGSMGSIGEIICPLLFFDRLLRIFSRAQIMSPMSPIDPNPDWNCFNELATQSSIQSDASELPQMRQAVSGRVPPRDRARLLGRLIERTIGLDEMK